MPEKDPFRDQAQISRLRHQVRIERFVKSGQDEHGQPSGSWRRIATAWADIEPISGRWGETARQLYPQCSHRFRIRYNCDVTRNDRIVWDSRTFHIGHLQNRHERGRWLDLLTQELF